MSMRLPRLLLMVGVSFAILGCTVHVVDRRPPERRMRIPPARPAGANIAAIDAAASLRLKSDRAEAFEKIAEGSFLSEEEQFYFIDRVAEGDLFRSDTADVLEALAKNPSLSIRGAEYLVQSFGRMDLFSSDQKPVSDILIDRTPVQ